jgi:small subunit ribosomal protein S1
MAKTRIRQDQFRTFDANILNATEYLSVLKEDENKLAELYEGKQLNYKLNDIISGEIIEKNNDGIVVDIKYKSNGFVPAGEFEKEEYKSVKIGDNIDVTIEELENKESIIALSYEKAKSAKVWKKIAQYYEENKPVEGVVTGKVKGGLYVDIGITVFLPGSQIDTQRVTDFDQWVGKKIQAYIIKLMPKRGNVIISRRKYIYDQKSGIRKEILESLSVGQVIQGTVKNITKYGAFVDIGGVDGLLHITDMTWSRIEFPTEVIKIGDVISVKVLSFDKETEKVSLGMKQLIDNPWDQLPENITTGSMIKGKIISIKDYGIFVEIMKGVEGLVHISEISWTSKVSDLHKTFEIGQEIETVVASLERKNRRMSLSIKQMEKNPWDVIFDKYQVGQRITGKITNIADFGFFVQIANGIDGLVHVSDISWTQHIKHSSDLYKKDDIVDVVIIDINKQKRKISLSVKELTENPWTKISEKVSVGSYISGTIVNIAEFGAFVKLQNSEVEAFIHASEFPQNSEEELKVGNEYNFRVIKVSPEEQKIGLSLRENQRKKKIDKKREKSKEYTASGASPQKRKSALQIELEKLMESTKNKRGE